MDGIIPEKLPVGFFKALNKFLREVPIATGDFEFPYPVPQLTPIGNMQNEIFNGLDLESIKIAQQMLKKYLPNALISELRHFPIKPSNDYPKKI